MANTDEKEAPVRHTMMGKRHRFGKHGREGGTSWANTAGKEKPVGQIWQEKRHRFGEGKGHRFGKHGRERGTGWTITAGIRVEGLEFRVEG